MRLAAIVDHRGRSATAIETSVFFVDSENAAARMKYTISRLPSSCHDSHLLHPCFPRSANNYATADIYIRAVDNNTKGIVVSHS